MIRSNHNVQASSVAVLTVIILASLQHTYTPFLLINQSIKDLVEINIKGPKQSLDAKRINVQLKLWHSTLGYAVDL